MTLFKANTYDNTDIGIIIVSIKQKLETSFFFSFNSASNVLPTTFYLQTDVQIRYIILYRNKPLFLCYAHIACKNAFVLFSKFSPNQNIARSSFTSLV